MPTTQAIQRVAEAGMAIVTQPIFLFAEIESYYNNLGPERTKQTYPIQTMLQAGNKSSLFFRFTSYCLGRSSKSIYRNQISCQHGYPIIMRIQVKNKESMYQLPSCFTQNSPGNHTDSFRWTACGRLSC